MASSSVTGDTTPLLPPCPTESSEKQSGVFKDLEKRPESPKLPAAALASGRDFTRLSLPSPDTLSTRRAKFGRKIAPSDDQILDFALGHHHHHPVCPRRLARISDARLLDRSPVCPEYGQRRKTNVARINRKLSLFLADSFHVILEMPGSKILLLFCLIYAFGFVPFAVIYWYASRDCPIGIESFADSMFFSVETMMTIGYGVPDPFFKGCHWLVYVIGTQVLSGLLLDAFLVGSIYSRLSAGNRRASTILFSDKAVIRTINGVNYFMFQVCEMRALQLVECHVRCYLYTRPLEDMHGETVPRSPVQFQMQPMRLEQPDDALGASMFLVLPTLVVHRIDGWSPFLSGPQHCGSVGLHTAPPSPWRPTPPQRNSETEAGVRSAASCPACGDCFDRLEHLRLHMQYQARPSAGPGHRRHADLLDKLPPELSAQEVRQQLQGFFRERLVEVVCIIEGVDPMTSHTVQARSSYTAKEIAWDSRFANCISNKAEPSGGTGILIDFGRFHDLEPCGPPVHGSEGGGPKGV